MKSRDIAVVGILLAIGAIVRYLSLLIPGPIVANLVIAFYCLAIILIVPSFKDALGIGIVAGIICALISHSIFPPANLISEPIGALVCLATYKLVRDRIPGSPGISTFVGTMFSGTTFVAVCIVVLLAAPEMLAKTITVYAFILATIPIVAGAALVNGIIAQMLYIPSARILMRGTE